MKTSAALVAACFLATPAVVAGTDRDSEKRCPRDELRTIEAPVTYRGPCVEILSPGANLVVERQVIERHAAGHALLEKDEAHPTLIADRAKRLLDLAHPASQSGCSQVRDDDLKDAIYYLGYLIERRLVVVYKAGTTEPTGTVRRIDSIGICSGGGFGVDFRAYGLPDGPFFLLLLIAIT